MMRQVINGLLDRLEIAKARPNRRAFFAQMLGSAGENFLLPMTLK
jgi:hypothetical protein